MSRLLAIFKNKLYKKGLEYSTYVKYLNSISFLRCKHSTKINILFVRVCSGMMIIF